MRLVSYARIACVVLATLANTASNATYWNLFNAESETDLSAQYVTYDTAADMLSDTNRLGIYTPDHFGAGSNIVGSGSNGSTYWSLFTRKARQTCRRNSSLMPR